MPPLLRDSFEEKTNSYPDCKGRIKCVLVGDGAVGKTSLIASYTTNGYSTEYTPTAFDNYNVIVNVDNQPILLQLCDTAGQDEFDHLRPLCYPGTDVYIVCFSVVSPTSFANVAARWLREIRLQAPQAPVILVGTQADLREDVESNPCYYRRNTVTEAEAHRLAESLGVVKYIECSALTQHSLKEVFDEAIFAALKSNAELWRLTAGRSKGNRILASFQQLRGSFSSDRNGPLRTSKRSKCSKEGGSSSSSSSSSIRQPCTTKDDMESKGRQRSWWKKLCCVR